MAKARKNAASASALPPSTPNDNNNDNNSSMNIGEYEKDGNDKRARGQLKWKLAHHNTTAVQYILRITTSTAFSIIAIVLILASSFFAINEKLQSTLMKIGMGYICIAKPLLSTLAVCCNNNLGEKGGTMTRIIAFSFLMSIVCNQLPKWMSALVACSAIFAFGLASHQLVPSHSESTAVHSQVEHRPMASSTKNDHSNLLQRTWSRLDLKERAAVGSLAVVFALLTENFLIWVVSATYQPGIDGTPEPLQDNGRIVLEKFATKIFDSSWKTARMVQTLRNSLNVQYALVSSFGAALVCLELKLGDPSKRRTLAGLAFRATSTLAAARIVRTISFVLTVVPSQVPNCYARHFPPPPEEWREWLMVGLLPSSRGGCNDLILSGHATITSSLACAFTSVAANTSFSIAVWTLIALDYSIEAYQGLHYSVDMWLGCIVTCLLWQLTKPLEIGGQRDQKSQNGKAKKGSTVRPPPLNATTIVTYAVPALVAFFGLTVVPEAFLNFFFMGYSLWVGVYLMKCGFTNLLQHVLMCELCLGLGTYL